MPRRVANAKLLFIFGTALEQIAVRHRFAHSKILKNSENAAFFVLLPDDVTQLSLIQKFSSEQRKCLEKIRQYGLFWFDRFNLFILDSLFYKFLSGFFSCKSAHLSLVTVVNV